MKKSILLSLSLLLSVSAFAQQYVLRSETIQGVRPATPPAIEVPGDGSENGGGENGGGTDPVIPTTYQCDGVMGRDSFTAICDNGILSGTLGRNAVTGTCSDFNYHAIMGRNESTGACNDLSSIEEPEQPVEVDLSYTSTHTYTAGGRPAGDMVIIYDHQNKSVTINATNTTGRNVRITTSSGYSGDIPVPGGVFSFPFSKGEESVYIDVLASGRYGTFSTEDGDVGQLYL